MTDRTVGMPTSTSWRNSCGVGGTPASPSTFFNDTATTEIYTLSLHDALPICSGKSRFLASVFLGLLRHGFSATLIDPRSEEHTSELQSQFHLVCRLLLEKKKTVPGAWPPWPAATSIPPLLTPSPSPPSPASFT